MHPALRCAAQIPLLSSPLLSAPLLPCSALPVRIMAAPAPAAAPAAAAAHNPFGSHTHLTPEQRAQRHVLNLPWVPALQQFQQLLALHSAPAGAGTAEDAALLDAMLNWCAALFLQHDRALASSNLFTDIDAAVRALRPHARRSSVSTSAKGSVKSSQRSSVSGSHDNAHADEHAGTGTGTGAGATIAETSLAVSDAPDPLVAVLARMSAYPFSGFISRISGELLDLVDSCGDEEVDNSWMRLNDKGKDNAETIKVFYRKLEGSGTHSFLVSGLVHSPLLNVLAMIKEADLMPKWLPAVKSADVLSELDGSRYRMLLRVIIKALWPVSDREAMCYGYGDVVGESIGIYFRSIDDKAKGEVIPGAGAGGADVRVPLVTEGCVRASVKMGGFWITPLTFATAEQPLAGSCRVRGLFNVDPMIPIIPFWFMNLMSEKFCSVILEMMREKAPNIFGMHGVNAGDTPTPMLAEAIIKDPWLANHTGTEYAKRLISQARVYDEIRRRIAEMHEAAAAGK